MSWITGWWKGEKKEVQKVENVPELGDDDKNIKNLVKSFRSDKTTLTGTLYFKPMIGLDCFKDYIKVDGNDKKYIEYAGDYEISYVDFGGGKLNLFFNKITIKENSSSIELDYLKDINFIRFSYIDEQFHSYHKADTSKSNITQITVVLQLINMDPESETIPALASVNDVPEVQITGNYVNAVLTNFKNFDKEDDVSKCKTNVVLSGSLNSFYNAGSNKILPRNFGSGTTQWNVISVNDVVKTGVNDENNAEIIIGFENESTLDLSVISNPKLTNTYWTNFYVRNVTMTSETDLTLPFHYYDGDTLRDSTLDYVISKIEETTSGNFQVLTIYLYSQNGNDFLDKYVVNGELQFDVRSTKLNSVVQSLTSIFFQRCLIVVEQMVREEDGNEFEIRCCSKEVSGANINCSSGTASCEVSPDYKITNLCCINTSDLDLKLDLNKQLPEASITLSTQQNTEFTYDNLYLTNLQKVGATNTNLLLEGDITQLYQYLPLKWGEYPEGYPELLKSVNTINDSPAPNRYLLDQSSMNLIDVEDVDIEKFGTIKDDKIDKQNVFLSSILVYNSISNKSKFSEAKLMSRNSVDLTRELGDGETPNYSPTKINYGRSDLVYNIYNNDSKTWFELNNLDDNNFLITVTENGKNYTDVYLNRDLTNRKNDMSYKFRTLATKYETAVLNMRAMRLCNKNIITFNYDDESETSIDMGNIRIHYYINDTTETYSVWPPSSTTITSEYKVYSVYMIYGNITDGNLDPLYANETNNETFKKEQEDEIITMSINLQKKNLLTRVYINEIYNTNFLIESIAENTNTNLPIYTNVVVNGVIQQWVFKELLPLPRYMNSNGVIVNGESRIQLVSINYLPCDFETLEVGIHLSNDICEINLSNVANKSAFDRMYSGEGNNRKKVFFVNKVTLLKRFKDEIDITGEFQYYEGTELKDCVYNEEDPSKSNITYADDWALKLPECSCEASNTKLTLSFDKYKQIGKDNYLLKDIVQDYYLYLDVSMLTIIDLSGISTISLILNELKYINNGNCIMDLFPSISSGNSIYLYYNSNGFITRIIKNEKILFSNINTCYAINGENREENSIQLITPKKDVFIEQDSKKCIVFKNQLHIASFLTINYLKVTNFCGRDDTDKEKIKELNILIAGEIPTWIMEYMPLPINLNYVTKDSNNNRIYELTDSSTYDLQITSVNALPTPDGDVGIDNIN